MRPAIDPQTLNAFVDGELDLLSQREIEQRIEHDDALRGEVQALRRLRQHVRDLADYHPAPEAFRQRIAALVPAPATLPARGLVRKGTLQRWVNWRPMTVSFAALALAYLALNLGPWPSAHDARIEREVVASHVRSTLGQHLVDVASSDQHTVKPWLSSKLDFSPPVPQSLLPGSVFLGGRVDYLDGRPVAALVYRQGAHIVNSFVWPAHAADRAATLSEDRGFRIAHWSRAGMTHWVISDVNRDEFEALVRALEAAGGDR
ncbi:MAG: anti-sigma factor [Burkholderiales bacterium]|nr:anti-sigma factor [Burkholderiales bacterium]MDE2300533.1 anti-sigma factor [Burkholderiales bacterium]MDE2626914.1 anti-sigma factor [Burkholderiales bacterium]